MEAGIPNEMLTNHDFLLEQLRNSYNKSDCTMVATTCSVPSIELKQLVEEISYQKEKLKQEKREKAVKNKAERMAQLKQSRLANPSNAKHEKDWKYSMHSESGVFSSYPGLRNDESSPEKARIDGTKRSEPWLPTCLHGQNFEIPSNSSFPDHFIVSLKRALEDNIHKCEQELSKLQGQTEEVVAERWKCTQAYREFQELLEGLKAGYD